MTTLHAQSSATIDAPADEIYRLMADYRTGHPRILPGRVFRDLTVEEGGYGAGTVIRFTTHVGGKDIPSRMIVTEPEPGRVLVETDTAPGSTFATTFTVTPVADRRAEVEIKTEWQARGGIAGLMERLFYPMGMRHLYRQELAQIATVVAEPVPAAVPA